MLVYINMYIAKIMQSKQKIPLIRQGALIGEFNVHSTDIDKMATNML